MQSGASDHFRRVPHPPRQSLDGRTTDPRRVPALIARPFAGSYGVATMTRAQGASNELAKRELGWSPQHASWRAGFRSALGW